MLWRQDLAGVLGEPIQGRHGLARPPGEVPAVFMGHVDYFVTVVAGLAVGAREACAERDHVVSQHQTIIQVLDGVYEGCPVSLVL